MPKRNIYFPNDLNKEMDRHKGEKWSVVCQEAVSARIRYLDLKSDKAASAVERARARLGPERLQYAKVAKDRGLHAGMTWAADHATFDELRRLYEGMTGPNPKIYFPLDDHPDVGLMVAYLISAEEWEDDIDPYNDERMPSVLINLCNQIGLFPGGADCSTNEFWEGFVEGAADVYRKV